MLNPIRIARNYLPLIGVRGFASGVSSMLRKAPAEFCVSRPDVGHPIWLRATSSDLVTYRHIFALQEYGFPVTKAPRVIVDAGANIGLASLYFANRFPDARVIAVEPAAGNVPLLKKNAAPYPHIQVVDAALWKENTELDLVDPGMGFWAFRTVEHDARPSGGRGAKHSVNAMTVNALLDTCGVDFIDVFKIDIEGAEVELFEHAASWLDRVGVIVIELHDRMRPGCSRTVFRATAGFEVAWEQGEYVFLARQGACASPPPGSAAYRS